MHKNKQFVRVLVRNNNGKYLVVSQRYGNKVLWNFPGGKVEPFEDPQEAAAREIKEEVGLVVSNLRLIWRDNLTINDDAWFGYFYIADVDAMTPSNKEKGLLRSYKFKNVHELNKSPSIKETLVEIAAILERGGKNDAVLPAHLQQMVFPLWHTDT